MRSILRTTARLAVLISSVAAVLTILALFLVLAMDLATARALGPDLMLGPLALGSTALTVGIRLLWLKTEAPQSCPVRAEAKVQVPHIRA